jgi:YD repeat-containing protein
MNDREQPGRPIRLRWGFVVGLALLQMTLFAAVPATASTAAANHSTPTSTALPPTPFIDQIVAACHTGNYTFAESETYDAENGAMYVWEGNGWSGPGGFNGLQFYSNLCTTSGSQSNVGFPALGYDPIDLRVYGSAPDYGFAEIWGTTEVFHANGNATNINGFTYDPAIAGMVASEGYGSPCTRDNVSYIVGTTVTDYNVPDCSVAVSYSNAYNTILVSTQSGHHSQGTVTALSAKTGAVLRSTNETGNPQALAYDALNHKTYVTFADTNFTYVFDGNGTFVAKINLHFHADSVAYSPTTGRMYFGGKVAQTGVSEIASVRNYTVTQTLNVSAYGTPYDIVYDPPSGDMYVTVTPSSDTVPAVLIVS